MYVLEVFLESIIVGNKKTKQKKILTKLMLNSIIGLAFFFFKSFFWSKYVPNNNANKKMWIVKIWRGVIFKSKTSLAVKFIAKEARNKAILDVFILISFLF